jgi:hypothetical protein
MSYKGFTQEDLRFLARIGQITEPPAAVKKPALKKEEEE